MKVEILKRIKRAEKKVFKNPVPVMIMIFYRPDKEKYCVMEHYEGRTETLFFDHYKQYIFSPKFDGRVFLDLMESPNEPEGANVYAFDIKEVREDVPADCGVSIEFEEHEEPLTSKFIVTVWE